MDKKSLVNLLRTALLYRVSAKLDLFTDECNFSDKEVSEEMGKASNWLNGVKNNAEDIPISSLARFFSVVYEKLPQKVSDDDSSADRSVSKESFLFSFFDQKILAIAKLINEIYDETTEDSFVKSISNDMTLYQELKSDWGVLSYKSKLGPEEVATMNRLKELIEGGED